MSNSSRSFNEKAVMLFIIMLLAGAFVYLFSKQHTLSPLPAVTGSSSYETPEVSTTKASQQLNVTMKGGIVQIHQQIDDLTQEQKKLMGMIDYDQQVLNDTSKEISDITNKVGWESIIDILRVKALELELKSDQRLLTAHGRQLTALNDQLNKKRKLLAEERNFININSESSLQSLQQHNALLNDRSAEIFDKVEQHMDDQRQKIEDQKQRLQDQQNR